MTTVEKLKYSAVYHHHQKALTELHDMFTAVEFAEAVKQTLGDDAAKLCPWHDVPLSTVGLRPKSESMLLLLTCLDLDEPAKRRETPYVTSIRTAVRIRIERGDGARVPRVEEPKRKRAQVLAGPVVTPLVAAPVTHPDCF